MEMLQLLIKDFAETPKKELRKIAKEIQQKKYKSITCAELIDLNLPK
jgi:hypothetical protein